MTTISVTPAARSGRATTTGFDFSAFARKAQRFIARISAEISRRRTERMLEGLPLDIRKDIGWPAPDQPQRKVPAARR
jgi:hypothetical protein